MNKQSNTLKTLNNAERLNKLYKDYGLTSDDYFKNKSQNWTIIRRSGIDKIQAKALIDIKYDLIYHSDDLKTAVIKAEATQLSVGRSIETFGEVSPSNSKNGYPIAIAEKRAMSRAVLKLAGFYELGAYSEDESEVFTQTPQKIYLRQGTEEWDNVVMQVNSGAVKWDDIKRYYEMSVTDEYRLESICIG